MQLSLAEYKIIGKILAKLRAIDKYVGNVYAVNILLNKGMKHIRVFEFLGSPLYVCDLVQQDLGPFEYVSNDQTATCPVCVAWINRRCD